MSEPINFQPQYPFKWLDDLIWITLNPEKTVVLEIPDKELGSIMRNSDAEFRRISGILKQQVFSLYSYDHLKIVAGHYNQAIRLLQQQMKINIAQYPATGLLMETGQYLLANLNDLYQNAHQRYDNYLRPTHSDGDVTKLPLKIKCRLSVDQIAIILKAADSLQIVRVRSFSELLRNIVPFLSTERFSDFSWKSARSSIYKIEDSDKEVTIQILERLVEKIRNL